MRLREEGLTSRRKMRVLREEVSGYGEPLLLRKCEPKNSQFLPLRFRDSPARALTMLKVSALLYALRDSTPID